VGVRHSLEAFLCERTLTEEAGVVDDLRPQEARRYWRVTRQMKVVVAEEVDVLRPK
jgi:hypothetical protein